jgi:hypothetical protein
VSTVQALRPWWIAAAIAGLLGWWLVPMPDAPPNLVKPRQDSWRLPALPRRVDQTSTAALVSGAGYWGAPVATAAPSAAPIEDPRWRVAAVYGAGSERGALVEFSAAGKPAQRLRVGDALPSGHRIVAIGERDICVLIGRKSFRLGVERSGS